MEKLSILLGKGAAALTKLHGGGGSALPGLVVEKSNPKFLRQKLSKLPYGTVIISGTNGKTTTTKIVAELLESQGLKVFTNNTGSNFVRGVISAILENIKLSGNFDYDIAVLELDEAHAVKFSEVADIDHALLLNVQLDQADRFSSVDYVAELLQTVALKAKKSLVLNEADPRLAKFEAAKSTQISYFGLNPALEKQFLVEKQAQNAATVSLNTLAEQKASFIIKDKIYPCTLQLKGSYNALNAAAALALCLAILPGAEPEKLIANLSKVESAYGRGESFKIDDVEVELLLVKNPSAFQLSLASFVDKEHDYMLVVNDRIADGQDITWLEKVNFDQLKTVLAVSGLRADDTTAYLKKADTKVKNTEGQLDLALDYALKNSKHKKLRIFATYTAMLELRKIIIGQSIS